LDICEQLYQGPHTQKLGTNLFKFPCSVAAVFSAREQKAAMEAGGGAVEVPPVGGSSPTGQPQAAAASADMQQYSLDCVLPPMNHTHDDYIHGGEIGPDFFGHDFFSPTNKRTEGRAPVWGSEFTSKDAALQGGSIASLGCEGVMRAIG
jgi:hypothetical protein